MGAYHTISSLICVSAIYIVSSAFESPEVWLLEDQNGSLNRQTDAHRNLFNDHFNDNFTAYSNASVVEHSRYLAATSPIIRFGKRFPQNIFGNSMTRHARTVAAYYLYSRFNRNQRPNHVELKDTMLRFG